MVPSSLLVSTHLTWLMSRLKSCEVNILHLPLSHELAQALRLILSHALSWFRDLAQF